MIENFIYDETSYFSKNDNIEIKSLGINASKVLDNSWFTNASPKYDVKSVSIIDSSNFTYSIETIARNNLKIGDKVTVIQSDGVENKVSLLILLLQDFYICKSRRINRKQI